MTPDSESAELELVSSRMRPYNKHASALLHAASLKLEADLGGREKILANLLTCPLPEAVEPFVAELGNPEHADLDLHQIAKLAKVTVPQLLHLYEQALRNRAKLISLNRIVERLPQVTADAMELSKIRENSCRKCKGRGTVVRKVKGEPVEQDCPECFGIGTITAEPSVPQQRVGLELGGLLEKGPLVNVGISQQTLAVTSDGGGDLVSLQKVVHQILSGGLSSLPAPAPDAMVSSIPAEGVLVEDRP